MLSILYRFYDHAKRKGHVLGQLSWASCKLQWHCPISNLKPTKMTSKAYFAESTKNLFCLHRLGYRWGNVRQRSFHHCSPGQQIHTEKIHSETWDIMSCKTHGLLQKFAKHDQTGWVTGQCKKTGLWYLLIYKQDKLMPLSLFQMQ